jgi:hypothetical protein
MHVNTLVTVLGRCFALNEAGCVTAQRRKACPGSTILQLSQVFQHLSVPTASRRAIKATHDKNNVCLRRILNALKQQQHFSAGLRSWPDVFEAMLR